MGKRQAENFVQGNYGGTVLTGQGKAAVDPRLQDAMQAYSSGKMSLADAIKSTQTGSGDMGGLRQKQNQMDAAINQLEAIGNPQARAQADSLRAQKKGLDDQITGMQNDQDQNRFKANQFFTDPQTGTLAATDQIQNNPMLSGMFGKGGMNDRLQDEEKDLASRGYSLKPEDNEAYGQASDNIARMFGTQEQSLSSALASRGLAAGASGAAGAGFSGLMGNKYEQLANQQRQIAQQRMQMNQQRLESVRNFAMQGTAQAQKAIGDQYDRNQQGVKSYQDSLKDSLNASQAVQGQANQEFQQQQETKPATFGDVLAGVGTSILGGGAGGVGKALGYDAGKAIGGKGFTDYATASAKAGKPIV